jgi:hypothetical protein
MSVLVPSAIRWPLISLDFEASGLGEGTYPIEVGVAVWHGPDTPIRSWSTLIAPTPDWVAKGVWKPEAAAIHNIPRGSLHAGKKPREVVRCLNAIIGYAGVALCDGGKNDDYWLQRLIEAGDEPVGFALASWHLITLHYSIEEMVRHCGGQSGEEPLHRAGPDAVLNIRLIAEALGYADLIEIPHNPPEIEC